MLVFIFISLFFVWLYVRTRKPKNFPPGPRRLPIVGSFPYLQGSGPKPSMLNGFTEQISKYGPIVGFYFGSTPAVLLADYKHIKECFKLDSISARPDFSPAEKVRPGYHFMNISENGRVPGVLFSHGPYWRELRRFMLRNLRDFGFGKTSMEHMFVEEVSKLCQILSKEAGQPINLTGRLNISILNALWAILTGEKLELEDPNLQRIVKLVNNVLLNSTPLSPIAAVLPHKSMGAWPLISSITGFKGAKAAIDSVVELVDPYIDDHVKNLDPDSPRDFLDLMLVEHVNPSKPDSCFASDLGKATIKNALLDLFFAGMETTSSSLMVVFLQLLHHPDIKEKVQQEIDRVVGKNRFPSFEDKEEMHLTNAVLLESLRVGSLAYLGLPHATLEDIKFEGYDIPKGTIIFGSIYHSMHDPKLYDDPHTFKPERFINADGKFVHDDRVQAFGTGKRACLGQSLAEKEFFIFFTCLLQQFNFDPAPGKELPSYKDIFPGEELIRIPKPYEVILTKRLLN